jgi:HAE1 family hydrophobic/amphiphilic exporter-1
MLVDYTNQRRAAGESIRTAFKRITHVFVQFDNHCDGIWYVPIALASGAGAEKRTGFALLGIMFIIPNLIIVPVIYEIMEINC